MGKPIVVIGSLYIQINLQAGSLPAAGETLHAQSAQPSLGVSGASLAAAAARAGARVILVGRTGADAFDAWARDRLTSLGVDVTGLQETSGAVTGLSCTITAETGERLRVIAPGANDTLTTADIDTQRDAMRDAGLVVVDPGIPLAVLEHAVSLAFHQGQKVLLRLPAGSQISERYLRYVHTLVVDEDEAAALAGQLPEGVEGARRAALALAGRGPLYVVVHLGKQGVAAAGPDLERDALSIVMLAVTGSSADGDVFCGRLAAGFAAGDSLLSALRDACAAGEE